MRVLGIVAEYDPFHLGHLFHLEESRRRTGADQVCIMLSGCFRQRGELSLLPPCDRAACALRSGADAVFELPVLWTVRDAEHYALGAVAALDALGCTDLAFGAETDDLPSLDALAALLEAPTAAFQAALRQALSEGLGYPAALSSAADICLPECAGLLASPNNILAVCYLRALRRLGSAMVPTAIVRRGSATSREIVPEAPSASALRSALRRGNYRPVFSAVPSCSEKALRRAFLSSRVPDQTVFDALLLSRLRALSLSELQSLPDVSEGLERAIHAAAVLADSRAELLGKLVSRRYTAARLNRIFTHALLGSTRERLNALALPSALRLIALRKGSPLTALWKARPVRLLSSAADWKASADPADQAAWHLYARCTHQPDTLPLSEKFFTC